MNALLVRILILGGIGVAIYLGVSRIWRDWSGQFKREADQERERRRTRDLSERQRPGVIDLKRDDDGTFRPGNTDENNRR